MKTTLIRFACLAGIVSLSCLTGSGLAIAGGRGNISDITGGNVSDITGGNVSDITGGNVSDITGTDTSNAVSPLDQESATQLANQMAQAYQICVAGGDCSAFYALFDQANNSFGF